MSDDDNELNDEEIVPDEEGELEADEDIADLEPDEEGDLEEPDEEGFEDDDETFVADDDADGESGDDDDDDEEESETTARVRKRKGEEDEDDDEDLIAPDDVEADLDRILKDRMVASDDEDDDEDDEEEVAGKGKAGVEAVDGLQPKRADETLCTNCFLLVRLSAPGCPVEDDACPIFG